MPTAHIDDIVESSASSAGGTAHLDDIVEETPSAPAKQPSAATGILGSAAETIHGFGEFGKGAAKEVSGWGENIADIVTLGLKPLLEKKIPSLGKARTEREQMRVQEPGLQKAGGTTAQVASMLAPIPGLQEIKAGAGAGRLARFGMTALRGGLEMGVKTAVQTGDVSEAAKAGAVAGATGAVIEAAAEPVSKLLKKMALSQYGKLLHPLGRKAKEVGMEEAPGVIESGYKEAVGLTKTGLGEKFAAKTQELGKQIEQEYAALDATSRTKLAPIYDSMDKWYTREAYTPGGLKKEGADALHAVVLDKMKLVNQMGNYMGDAQPSELWSIRKSLDDYVFSNRLTAEESMVAANRVRKALSDSIRGTLNEAYPDLAKLNNSYHRWRTVSELMERNIQSDFGKLQFARNTGVVGRFLMGAAVGGEAEREHGGGGIWGYGGAMALGGLAMQSTAWRSVSAVTKDKIANLLAKGEGEAAANLAARATGVVRGAMRTEPQPAAQ
jgi:hypothetical protein